MPAKRKTKPTEPPKDVVSSFFEQQGLLAEHFDELPGIAEFKAAIKPPGWPYPQVIFFTSKPVIDHLERLVKTGLYGPTIGTAAERLICQSLREELQA